MKRPEVQATAAIVRSNLHRLPLASQMQVCRLPTIIATTDNCTVRASPRRALHHAMGNTAMRAALRGGAVRMKGAGGGHSLRVTAG